MDSYKKGIENLQNAKTESMKQEDSKSVVRWREDGKTYVGSRKWRWE